MTIQFPEESIRKYLKLKTQEDINTFISGSDMPPHISGTNFIILIQGYLWRCLISELPLYINHPKSIVREVLKKRLGT